VRREASSILVLATAVTLSLSSCSSTAKDPEIDHTEALAELDELFAIAQDAVGGEWERAGGGATPCALPSGMTGAQSSFTRIGPGLPDDQQQSVLDTVEAGWTAAEFIPELGSSTLQGADVAIVRYPKSGFGEDGLYLDFRMTVHGSVFEGQTRCVPGDYAEINRNGKAEQNQTFSPSPSP
jgi:hypothetical protein